MKGTDRVSELLLDVGARVVVAHADRCDMLECLGDLWQIRLGHVHRVAVDFVGQDDYATLVISTCGRVVDDAVLFR
jgi:hypothetical protein